MDDINVPIFSQAKLEYTKQLVDILYMNMYDGVRSIYDDAKVLNITKRTSVTQVFRTLLEQVPKWNTEIIESETDRIEKSTKCDWLDDLLTAVFISHTRILMSIGTNQNFNKINVTIPKTTTFIHKTYINIAREVWKNPYLFDEQVIGHEYQRNMKQLEDMIKLIIEDTIRRQLPIKEILREHLENYDEPKQTQQQPLDMKTLVEEIRKAGLQYSEPDGQGDTTNYESDDNEENASENPPKLLSMFNREEDLQSTTDNTNTDNTDKTDKTDTDTDKISTSEPSTSEQVSSNIYNDPDDPNASQIIKGTQNIVLNDITEPVIEGKYDNTDIISPTKIDQSSTKLDNMIKELSMDTKKGPEKQTCVVKIDTVNPPKVGPSIVKIDTVNPPKVGPSIVKIDEPLQVKIDEPLQVKIDEPLQVKASSPFSFDSLYSGITGLGKVEDIKEGPRKEDKRSTIVIKETETKDINALVMKEVISLDKKDEQIDETQTLDNFFNDVQIMANPMEEIKEETKYTLFENAAEKEP